MELIVDANELFSAIIAKGRGLRTKKLDILFSDKVYLFSPSLLFYELEKNRGIIKEKAGFSDEDFEVFMEILKLRITIVPLDELAGTLLEAIRICPHSKDIPYFAAALMRKCPVWSGDKALKKQKIVEIFNTLELTEKFKL